MLDGKKLEHYENWFEKSAEYVLHSAIGAGGWESIFSTSLPDWANKVRNYFNVTPQMLKRLDKSEAAHHLKRVNKAVAAVHLTRVAKVFPGLKDGVEKAYEAKYKSKLPKPDPNTPGAGFFDDLGESFALSGDVYEDDQKHIWYQMSAGATVYHWGSDPEYPTGEALQYGGLQRFVPVFKLVSPDGSGGSSECIIRNDLNKTVKVAGLPEKKAGETVIGAVNEWVSVRKLIVKTSHHQGSYNYSETVERGLPAHEMRDVLPHKRMGGAYHLYKDPPDRFMPLALRRFPRL